MTTDVQFSAPVAPDATSGAAAASLVPIPLNCVVLIGALAEPVEERELAGGVSATRWTLRVSRGPDLSGSDLLDCVALEPDLREQAAMWELGAALRVEGALRRRFFRTGGRTATRVEVEVHSAVEQAAQPEPAVASGA